MLITLSVIGGFAVLVAAVTVFTPANVSSLGALSADDARHVIEIVGFSQLLVLYNDPLNGVIGASVGAQASNLLFGVARAMELAGVAIGLQFGATPVSVAMILLATTILSVAVSFAVAIWCAPWISFNPFDFDLRAVKETWKASLSFFCMFVFMSIINVQVTRVIVFHVFGAAVLASFSVLLTYTRAARLIASMLSQAAQVEIGREFGRGSMDGAGKLIQAIVTATLGIGLAVVAVELLLAPVIIPLWTQGRVATSWSLLAILSLVAVAGTYFDALVVPLGAFNRVSASAAGYGAGLLVGLGLGMALLPWLGLSAIALYLLVPELIGS